EIRSSNRWREVNVADRLQVSHLWLPDILRSPTNARSSAGNEATFSELYRALAMIRGSATRFHRDEQYAPLRLRRRDDRRVGGGPAPCGRDALLRRAHLLHIVLRSFCRFPVMMGGLLVMLRRLPMMVRCFFRHRASLLKGRDVTSRVYVAAMTGR